jgi:hypothetical protein
MAFHFQPNQRKAQITLEAGRATLAEIANIHIEE